MCHINLAVFLLLGAGPPIELQLSVPTIVRSGDAVPVRERLHNSGPSDAELIAVVNVNRSIVNLDSGEVFGPQFFVVPSSQHQAPKVLQVVRRGTSSRWFETDLKQLASPPQGCPSQLDSMPPGNYEISLTRTVRMGQELREVTATARLSIVAVNPREIEQYSEWRRTMRETEEGDVVAVQRFRGAYPGSRFEPCAVAQEVIRLAYSHQEEARQRLRRLEEERRYSEQWLSVVRFEIEQRAAIGSRDTYATSIYQGKGRDLDAFRAAARGDATDSRQVVGRLRAFLEAWPRSAAAPEVAYLLASQLRSWGTCCGTEGASPEEVTQARHEAKELKERMLQLHPGHPRLREIR